MPELPEVETIVRELRPRLVGARVTGCRILRADIVGYPGARSFAARLRGSVVTGIKRRGKYLIFELSQGKTLVVHLRLSGALVFQSRRTALPRFARLVIYLSHGRLVFEEPRVLGRVYLLMRGEEPSVLAGLRRLSPEPLTAAFDRAYFLKTVKKRRTAIKQVLLSQDLCAGVGNIYSDEALFRAGIRPRRRSCQLSAAEAARLLEALKEVLKEGIAYRGTSVSDYKRTDGTSGAFQHRLNVYGREGEPCRRCGTAIAMVKVGSRRARYCPLCQR